MTRTLTLEGDMTDDDVEVNLTAQGSTTAPSRQVPADAEQIVHIVASITFDCAAAGAAIFFIRISEGGITGVQTIVVGGGSHIAVQSGADSTGARSVLFQLSDVNIDVEGGQTIKVTAEHAGDDLGQAEIAVTLIFG